MDGGWETDSNGGGFAPRMVRAAYDWTRTAPSIAIIETIATIEDTDPRDLSITLNDYVEPEALDTLFGDDRRSVDAITVGIGDYTVQITDSELIVGHP